MHEANVYKLATFIDVLIVRGLCVCVLDLCTEYGTVLIRAFTVSRASKAGMKQPGTRRAVRLC